MFGKETRRRVDVYRMILKQRENFRLIMSRTEIGMFSSRVVTSLRAAHPVATVSST